MANNIKIVGEASDWILIVGGVNWGLALFNGFNLLTAVGLSGTALKVTLGLVGVAGVAKLLIKTGVLK